MKIAGYKYPNSSFLSQEKDMEILVGMIMKNDIIKNLLYYNDKDCLTRSYLNDKQTQELFQNNIKIIPKLKINPEYRNHLIINFDHFVQSQNPEFRDNIIEFCIICHFDQWHLKDFQLRPYKIAAEIDTMLNNKRLTGIGEIHFIAGEQILINDDYAGVCLTYYATHGGEDKKKQPTPQQEEQFLDNFNRMFNSDDEQ